MIRSFNVASCDNPSPMSTSRFGIIHPTFRLSRLRYVRIVSQIHKCRTRCLFVLFVISTSITIDIRGRTYRAVVARAARAAVALVRGGAAAVAHVDESDGGLHCGFLWVGG
jgi:hypothetical protein